MPAMREKNMKTDSRLFSRREIFQKVADGARLAALAATSRGVYPQTRCSMPGLYPGRVVSVTHRAASINLAYQTEPIQNMIRKGVVELTGAPNFVSGWKQMFGPADVVGIKVNSNGVDKIIGSSAALNEILQGLLQAGVLPGNITLRALPQAGQQDLQLAAWLGKTRHGGVGLGQRPDRHDV
jgi:hypothetical protein